jgi:hypothetical protein
MGHQTRIHLIETAAAIHASAMSQPGAMRWKPWPAAAIPARAAFLQARLELERLANHTGDLGALAGMWVPPVNVLLPGGSEAIFST